MADNLIDYLPYKISGIRFNLFPLAKFYLVLDTLVSIQCCFCYFLICITPCFCGKSDF